MKVSTFLWLRWGSTIPSAIRVAAIASSRSSDNHWDRVNLTVIACERVVSVYAEEVESVIFEDWSVVFKEHEVFEPGYELCTPDVSMGSGLIYDMNVLIRIDVVNLFSKEAVVEAIEVW